MSAKLKALRPDAPPPLVEINRGPFLDAKQISERFYGGRFSSRWIVAHVATDKRRKLGKCYLWHEKDVVDFINKQ